MEHWEKVQILDWLKYRWILDEKEELRLRRAIKNNYKLKNFSTLKTSKGIYIFVGIFQDLKNKEQIITGKFISLND